MFANSIFLVQWEICSLGREGIEMSGCVEDNLRSFILSEIKLPNDCEMIFGGAKHRVQ